MGVPGLASTPALRCKSRSTWSHKGCVLRLRTKKHSWPCSPGCLKGVPAGILSALFFGTDASTSYTVHILLESESGYIVDVFTQLICSMEQHPDGWHLETQISKTLSVIRKSDGSLVSH